MDEIRRIDRRLTLHDLRVLMVVVEAGSMSKAARLLATSRPAVSRSTSDLEHALGVHLPDRNAKGIEPTPFGCALLKRAAAVFDELLQGIKDIRFLSDPTSGALVIDASIAIAEGFICEVFKRLASRHPRLSFHVHATDTATAYQALLARKLDLAVVHIIEPPAEDLMHVEPLLQDPHVVVAGAHNPIVRRRRLGLAELMEEPWALPLPDQPYGRVVDEAFRAHGLKVPPVVVGSTLPLRTALLMTGRFLSMAPRVVLRFPPKRRLLRALPIDLPLTARPLALVTLKNRTLNPLAQLFGDHIREAARPLDRPKTGHVRVPVKSARFGRNGSQACTLPIASLKSGHCGNFGNTGPPAGYTRGHRASSSLGMAPLTAGSLRSRAEVDCDRTLRRWTVLRRFPGLAAVGFMIILAWPSFAVGQQSEPLRRLRNHIHQDMTTCIAFFRLVSRCLAKNPQYAKAAAAYARATDDLLYKSILLGKQIGISDDDAKLRLGAATDEMAQLINKDCGNISSLLGRHLDKCTAVASDPLNPLKNAEPKP